MQVSLSSNLNVKLVTCVTSTHQQKEQSVLYIYICRSDKQLQLVWRSAVTTSETKRGNHLYIL